MRIAWPTVKRNAAFARSLLVLGTFFICAAVVWAQAPLEAIGRIEGEDVSVKGQISLVRDAGRNAALLVSGSEVTVRAGQARIMLEAGGEIDVCGPARFSLLKSGGSLTLALHSGCVRLRLASAPPLNVFSAALNATALSIADGPRDAVLGLEADGTMCVAALRGVVRIEHQLSGQNIVVPQNTQVLLPRGEWEALETASDRCRCEVSLPRSEPLPLPRTQATTLTIPVEPKEAAPEPKEPPRAAPPATSQPEWKVMMPPLSYQADAPAAQPSAEVVWLVREARVQPAAIFTGRIEPRTLAAKTAQAKRAAETQSPNAKKSRAETEEDALAQGEQNSSVARPEASSTESGSGFGARLKNFFRRLFGRKS
jgi:hypothetical protein